MLDYTKWSDENKLEWLIMELGDGADLVTFATKFLELFGNTRMTKQKASCLELFRRYANIAETDEKGAYEDLRIARKPAYNKECQIPPQELQGFQRLWDEDAPNRCLECSAHIGDDAKYCEKHHDAGMTMICRKFIQGVEGPCDEDGYGPLEPTCGGEVVRCENGMYLCQTCGDEELADMDTSCASSSALAPILRRARNNARALSQINVATERSKNHVAEWTRRKRA